MVDETLFWIHALVVLTFMLLGFFLSLVAITVVIFLHLLHLRIFNGCALTKLQQKVGSAYPNEYFFQTFFRRMFNIELGGYKMYAIQFLVLITPLLVASARALVL